MWEGGKVLYKYREDALIGESHFKKMGLMKKFIILLLISISRMI